VRNPSLDCRNTAHTADIWAGRKALNLAANSGPQREMFNIQCFGRLGPLFATGSFRSDSLAIDSQSLVSAYCAIEKVTESFS
jgi:hypothetical protein